MDLDLTDIILDSENKTIDKKIIEELKLYECDVRALDNFEFDQKVKNQENETKEGAKAGSKAIGGQKMNRDSVELWAIKQDIYDSKVFREETSKKIEKNKMIAVT